jgi:hypothetical protein
MATLIDTHITKNKATGVHARGAGVALSDTEQTDVTVTNSPITENSPRIVFPSPEVPTRKNSASRSRPKG